jgi:GTP-binding protein HflX
VVFDNELAPAQQYNLEKVLGRTAIDRTAVILDIFAQNAHTLEGKAQVELALLRYRLPRLRRGANAKLSQQRGGVGSRFGSGETKLEVDRRRSCAGSASSSPSSKGLSATRDLQRKSRSRSGLAAVTIVGYTNAGKSTLLNLPHPRRCARRGPDCSRRSIRPTRRLSLPGGEPVSSPTRSASSATSRTDWSRRSRAPRSGRAAVTTSSTSSMPPRRIRRVRSRQYARCSPRSERRTYRSCWWFNKADVAPEVASDLGQALRGSVAVSALTGEGIDTFLFALGDRLRALSKVVELSFRTTAAISSQPSTGRARWCRPTTTTRVCASERGSATRRPAAWPSTWSRPA